MGVGVITLGSEGEQLQVVIPVDADFVTTLTASSPWPVGTTIELHFSDPTLSSPTIWTASVSGSDAVFNVPKSTVQAVVVARLPIARLIYSPGGSGTLLWGHGTTRFV